MAARCIDSGRAVETAAANLATGHYGLMTVEEPADSSEAPRGDVSENLAPPREADGFAACVSFTRRVQSSKRLGGAGATALRG